MPQHPRLAFAAAAAAWVLLAAATLWNARENQALRAELALLQRQQAAIQANARAPVPASAVPVASAVAALPAEPQAAAAPLAKTKPATTPPTTPAAPATLEEALARWREAPARAAANPFGTP